MVMGLPRTMLELGLAITVIPWRVSKTGISVANFLLTSSIAGQEKELKLTDAEYTKHRLSHPISRVLRESSREIVIETVDGSRERWIKPSWKLADR